ncbi:MAG: hypothetical protein PT955_07155, partial [Bacteroidales bacterium]|nr:hypothetical protein [Bacteroidales bacterium]
PAAKIETDEERTYFLIDIPCHPDFIKEQIAPNKDDAKELTERQRVIIEMISTNPFLSAKTISEKISEKASEKNGEKFTVSDRTIENDLAQLKKKGILAREGGRKEGKWVILNKKE